MRVIGACVAVAVCLPAAPAAAATVTAKHGLVLVEASRGERNRLEILVGRRVVVREDGRTPLTAARGCRQVRARAVRCGGYLTEVRVDAGDRQDRVTVPRGVIDVRVSAGPGRDRVDAGTSGGWLRGGPGDDVLRGGEHGDFLFGGEGDDRLSGGPGSDHLDGDARSLNGWREGTAGDDVLAGGRGRDTASWEQRRRSVAVDLGRQIASSAVDADRLRSIENAAGGHGSDRLVGDARRNRLEGGTGRDLLAGLAGDDHLDVVGRGLLYVEMEDRVPDRLECGPGDDVVHGAVRGPYQRITPEPIPRDCERLTDGGYDALYGMTIRVQPIRVTRRRLRIPVACSLEYSRCPMRVTLTARGVRLGRSRLVRVRSGVWRVTVRLRRPLPARGVIDVRVHDRRDGGFRYRLRR